MGRSLYYCATQRLSYPIEKYHPQTSRQVLKKLQLMMKHRFTSSNSKSPIRRRRRREWTRAVREEERDRLREERKQGHQSNDQRKIACTRTSATHGSSDIPRLSPSGLGGVVRSASCRRVVMVAAIRRSQPASLAPIYLLTSNPTETFESPSNSFTLRNC